MIEDEEMTKRRSDREKSQIPPLVFPHVTPHYSPTRLSKGSGSTYQVHQMKTEIAKKELQNALRPIRGKRVEKAELDALVEKILDGTRTKTDGTSVPNTTWEYLLRSEILSLAVRLSLSFFLSTFDYQGLTQASLSPSALPPCFVKPGHRG